MSVTLVTPHSAEFWRCPLLHAVSMWKWSVECEVTAVIAVSCPIKECDTDSMA